VQIGDVCNEHGDILLFGCQTMEGRFALPIGQAICALCHGWRWLHLYEVMDDVAWIMIQRGGEKMIVRR
jgi:hypothetical protein